MLDVNRYYRRRPSLVFTNGCFDIIHVGHVRLLHWAKSLGGRLVVGLNSDDSVTRIKGRSPIMPEAERREILLSLKSVDDVVIFHEDDPRALMTEIRPDVLVKGPEYRGREILGADLVKLVEIPEWEKRHSSSFYVARASNRGGKS